MIWIHYHYRHTVDELWIEVRDIVQETGIKTIPMEKKCKKAKWLSGEALQIAVKRREVKSKGEKERYKHLNAEFQGIARRHQKTRWRSRILAFFAYVTAPSVCLILVWLAPQERLHLLSEHNAFPTEHCFYCCFLLLKGSERKILI